MLNSSSKTIFILLAMIGLVAGSGCSSRVKSGPEAEQGRIVAEPSGSDIIEEPAGFRIHPRAFDYYVNGTIYEEAGAIMRAADNYKRALQYYPNSYVIRSSYAHMLYVLQEFDSVIEVLEVIQPEDVGVWELRAASYRTLGKIDQAAEAYKRVVQFSDHSPAAYAFLANHYRHRADIDSVIWSYENLTRLRPDDFSLWYDLGRLQVENGDAESARISFASSIEARADSNNIMSFVRLGEIYQAEQKHDSAAILLKEACQIDPNNVLINRMLASHYVNLDSLSQALAYAHRVVQGTPQDRFAARRLGIIYLAMDSLSVADSIFTALIDSGERNAGNHYYLGRTALLNDDLEKARVQFDIVTQLADSLWESWLDLGAVYRLKGEPEKEIETYKVGMEHVADSVGTVRLLFALGSALEQNNRVDSAIVVFEQLRSKAPDDAKALNYLGYMLADRGERLDYARELIEKAVAAEPENAAFLDSYGWVLYRLGEFENALGHLKQAATLDNDPVIFDHLGDAYEAVGQIQQAREWWQKALQVDPKNQAIRSKLDE